VSREDGRSKANVAVQDVDVGALAAKLKSQRAVFDVRP